jgi:moderate conductance mechanosensitive channel
MLNATPKATTAARLRSLLVAFLPFPSIAILQDQTISEGFKAILERLEDFFTGIVGDLVDREFVVNAVVTVIVVILAIVFYRVTVGLTPRVLRWRRPEADRAQSASARARIKHQDTAVTLVRNALWYITFAFVTIFVVSIFLRDVLPTIAGATVLAILVAYVARDFLGDILAGFLILLEGQYNVGDFITLEPSKASGLVEDFGLRTTTIRSLSDLIYIPNGSITGVTKSVSGQQRFTIEVQLKDEEAANRVLEAIKEDHELYLTPPRLLDRDETPEGYPRLRVLAGVLPSTAWLVEENLVERIKTAASEDGPATDPLIYKVDRQSIQDIRDIIPPEYLPTEE